MVLITSGSYRGIKEATNALAIMASGGKVISKIGVMNSPGMNDTKKNKQSKKLRREAKKFVKKMKKPFNFKPTFGYLVWFSAFKAMSQVNENESIADHEYYSNKDFFIEMNLKLGQKFVLKTFQAIFRGLLKIGLV